MLTNGAPNILAPLQNVAAGGAAAPPAPPVTPPLTHMCKISEKSAMSFGVRNF